MRLRHLSLIHQAIGLHSHHVWHELLLHLLLQRLLRPMGCFLKAPRVMVMLVKAGRGAPPGMLLLLIQSLVCMMLHRELRLILQLL